MFEKVNTNSVLDYQVDISTYIEFTLLSYSCYMDWVRSVNIFFPRSIMIRLIGRETARGY